MIMGKPLNGNTIFLKIGNEIKSGVVGSAATSIGTVTSVEGTDSDHADGTTVELYMIHEIPLTEINKTHTSISNVGIDSTRLLQLQTPHLMVTEQVVVTL